ncbi:MAG: redoxin domain-containing protein [Chloroflexi bacterium]|nr:redoxin domain-containing protein [Chloroflexota bacterium]
MKEEYSAIAGSGAQVVAISADNLESHQRFAEAMGGCPFPLASDEKLEVARLYGVVSEDGRRSNRALFVIDGQCQVTLAIPWYQPGNMGQLMELFQALGLL